MSKSLGNFVGLRDEPNLMYGRVMSLSDEAMPDWFRLASGLEPARGPRLLDGLEAGELAPVEAKRLLARTVVARFHDDGRGRGGRGGVPARPPPPRAADGDRGGAASRRRSRVPARAAGRPRSAIGSNSEARRLIEGGGVRLEGEPVAALELPAQPARGPRDAGRQAAFRALVPVKATVPGLTAGSRDLAMVPEAGQPALAYAPESVPNSTRLTRR